MNKAAFLKAYHEGGRNGASCFYNHPMVKSFQYSNGVQECAEAGCYWLLDIAATELPKAMRAHGEANAFLEVGVWNARALLRLTVDDAKPAIWSKVISYTDMPEGRWVFELGDEGTRVAMILLSEH